MQKTNLSKLRLPRQLHVASKISPTKKCSICGRTRLNRKSTIYVRKDHFGRAFRTSVGTREYVPVCSQCFGLFKNRLCEYTESKSSASSAISESEMDASRKTVAQINVGNGNSTRQMQPFWSNHLGIDVRRSTVFLSSLNSALSVLSLCENPQRSSSTTKPTLTSNQHERSVIPIKSNDSVNVRDFFYTRIMHYLKLLLGADNPAKDVIAAFISGMSPQNTLEIGSGFDPFVYTIEGEEKLRIRSDISRADLAVGKSIAAKNGHSSFTENLTCDGLLLPFKTKSIDLIVTINMLHHLKPENRSVLFSEISRVLRSGGFYAITEILSPHRNFTGCLVHITLHHLMRGEKHPSLPELNAILCSIQQKLNVIYYDVFGTWRGDYASVIARKEAN